MKKYVAYILAMLLPPMSVLGIERVGTTSFQFLKIPVGVRGIGMGNAFVAGAVDASAVYWNPAGLGWATRKEILLTHLNLPADIKYDNVALLLPVSTAIGSFGLNIGVLHMDDLVVRTPSRPEGTGELFTASDIAVGLSYSRQVSNRFTFGVQVRYIREELANYVSSGVSFDAGLQYQTDFRSLRLGMVIQNFGADTKFDGSFLDYRTASTTGGQPRRQDFDSAPLPMTFKTGVLADLETMTGVDLGESVKGNLAAQFEHPPDNKERLNGGLELTFNERFSLRGGYNFNYDTDGFTLGFGVNVPFSAERNVLRVDYAYADLGNLTDTSSFMNQPHRFSLSFQF
ncbi:MAG: PorV/PorQ family protein [candidate division KSB1 bacterium]|nr:PorV/PorQ family protein [candidate division KSB1 bacterium]MDZ7276542.1 PorV/PorQ family protein [candidate division KSB1 bacterium]MDZ7285040.1 PorV/PorQ family protein [candidate division KSB1 bacterium]MDZ7298072.1 PorV/PorQ family protein [candidate division KSB1 bacterium]MDZ7307696.1 PorV/PorQ family protein [candidate division KSB1 bacterium]